MVEFSQLNLKPGSKTMISSISSGYSSATTSWSQTTRQDPSEMAKSLFTTTDTDGDGVITNTELSSALGSMAQTNGSTGPDAEELFSTLDADGDGAITEEEHETGLASLHKDLASQSWMTSMQMSMSSSMPSAEDLFASTDADSSGGISLEELQTALKSKGDGNGPSAEELFSTLDADGDGVITETEHSEGLASMKQPQGTPPMGPPPSEDEEDTTSLVDELFAQTDTDGDGILDKDELSSSLSGTDTASLLENFFNTFDTESSGTITQSEITDILNQQSTSLTSRLAQSAYSQYQYQNQDLATFLSTESFNATA